MHACGLYKKIKYNSSVFIACVLIISSKQLSDISQGNLGSYRVAW